ncbi:MAG: hypothetical protein ACTSQ8_19285 [Candidatus Helarchaeota archaeon]
MTRMRKKKGPSFIRIGLLFTIICTVIFCYQGNYCISVIFQTENTDSIQINMAEDTKLLWNYTFGGTNMDYGYGVAVASDGSIYCVGKTYSFGAGEFDFMLIKYSPNGTREWNATWGGSGKDEGKGVAIASDGSIYCVGSTQSFGAGDYDLALVKFYSNGTRSWNITWGGAKAEFGRGVAIAPDGSVYCVGGTTSFGNGKEDLALIKFSQEGIRIWNVTWGGTENDRGRGIAITNSGVVFCTGSSQSVGAGLYDLVLLKYVTNVSPTFAYWGGPDNEDGNGVAIAPDGSVYCIGYTNSFGAGSSDLALVKYGPDCTRLWNISWGGSSFDDGFGVAIATDGSVYCVGFADYGVNHADLVLLKFYPNGTRSWTNTWSGPNTDEGCGVAIATDGSVYCAGYTNSFGTGNYDSVLLKFEISTPEEEVLPGGIPGFAWFIALMGLATVVMIYLIKPIGK